LLISVQEFRIEEVGRFNLFCASLMGLAGYLCYGVPGSGKTSLISAIAGHFSLPVYIVNLAQSG
jgi:DNA replication protein DnaC